MNDKNLRQSISIRCVHTIIRSKNIVCYEDKKVQTMSELFLSIEKDVGQKWETLLSQSPYLLSRSLSTIGLKNLVLEWQQFF